MSAGATNDRWQRAQALIDAALPLSADDRVALMARECGDDSALRREVEAYLAADASRNSVLDRPLVPPLVASTLAQATLSMAGQSIGDYQLVREIGEGGMGVVYEAKQAATGRDFALKIIQPGMASRAMVRRFHAERRTLAQMNHPGVTSVTDAGVTDAGLPWFVMELVRGTPITIYSDQQRLSINDRLRLFLQVCAAVAHAHSKLVIHRDLKPTNVLVHEIDGQPAVKVIDFGVAKLIHDNDSPHTLATLPGQVIGTPAYMSSEQLRGEADIDTRSDVHSLGVMFFELLTGVLPRESASAKARTGDDDVALPSTRLSHMHAERLSAIASARRVEPAALVRLMRRDLDAIAHKATAASREERYATVDALAEDVQRYLEQLPVKARRATTRYRFERFVRRNRGKVAAMAAAFIALAALSAGLLVQSNRAQAHAEEARWRSYVAAIAAANSAISSGDGAAARRFLEDTDLDYRRAEWHMLSALADTSIWSHEVSERAEQLAFSRDGRLLALGSLGLITLIDPAKQEVLKTCIQPGRPYEMAITPDNRFVVTAKSTKAVVALEINTGASSVICDEFAGEVRTIALNADGSLLAAGSDDCTVRVFKREGDHWTQCAGPLQHEGKANVVRFAPDGRTLAVGVWLPIEARHNRTVRIWDAPTGRPIRTLERHGVDVNSVDFSGDGRWLAVGSDDKTISVWNTSNWMMETALSGMGERAYVVAFDPLSKHLAAASYDMTVHVWKVDDWRFHELMVGHRDFIWSMCWSPDGSRLYTGSWDRTGRAWNLEDGKQLATFAGHGQRVVKIACDPTGRFVATASEDRSVRLWDAQQRDVRQMPRGGNSNIAFTPSFSRGIATHLSHPVCWFDPRTGATQGAVPAQSGDCIATISPDGRFITSTGGSELRVWRIEDDPTVATLVHHAATFPEFNFAPFNSDGSMLAYLDSAKQLLVLDVPAFTVRHAVTIAGGPPASVAFTPDDEKVIVVASNTPPIVLNVSTGLIDSVDVGSIGVTDLLRTSDVANVAAYRMNESEIALLDLRNMRAGPTVRIPEGVGHALCVSRDGTRVALSATTGGVRVLDVANGEVVAEIGGPRMTNLIFSLDGQRLIGASDGGSLHVMVADTLEPLLIAPAHSDEMVEVMRFSLDGSTLFTASRDGSMRFWRVAE